jgi:benzoyl-CoA reductase/2-hydroxyglutaryl-CoA dehydratase subunit BcrC/BadD/HgdB
MSDCREDPKKRPAPRNKPASPCCAGKAQDAKPASPCCAGKAPAAKPASPCCAGGAGPAAAGDGRAHFANMIPNAIAYARQQKAAGRPIVGIMCEYTPREIILAAGAVPICLCGGAVETIPPAEEHLPANLCPLIKSTYGYHVTGANPLLEMCDLLVAETTCDGKKKMYELLADSREMILLELPHRADAPAALARWTDELRRLRSALERRFGVGVTPARLRDAIARMNRERALRRDLAALMKRKAPPLTGRELLDYKSVISAIPDDMAHYAAAVEKLSAAEGCASLAGRTRVLLTGVPVLHGAERVLDIIEDAGGLVVCLETCTGVRPILEDVDERAADPIAAIAEKYYHLPCSVMTRNTARLDSLRQLAREYRADCMIDLIWQACLTYDVESYYVRRLAGELNLPYLRIETDYSPSDSARIAVRVEALFETVKGAAKG